MRQLRKVIFDISKSFDMQFAINGNGIITDANSRFCDCTGFQISELLNKDYMLINNVDLNPSVLKQILRRLRSNKIWKGTIACKKKSGVIFWMAIVAVPKDNNCSSIYGEDITRHNNLEANLIRSHYIDPLTNLRNNKKFQEDIFLYKETNFLGILDIDDFSSITNFYGEDLCNKILCEVVERITNDVRVREYKIYRLFGDTFAFISSTGNMDVRQKTIEFTDIMSTVFSKPFNAFKTSRNESNNRFDIHLSATVGSSSGKDKNIFNEAYLALKRAKKLKCKSIYYVPELKKTRDDFILNQEKTIMVSESIKAKRINPMFQPIVDNKTNKIAKFECLARLTDSKGNIIGPDIFVPISKKIKLYENITMIMIEKCFEVFSGKNFDFSINLSKEDLLNQNTREFIIENVKKFPDPRRITFELVEDEDLFGDECSNENSIVNGLKELGCKIAIDDFGAGYSNFHYIVHLGAEYLKFDKNYITLLSGNDAKSENAKKAISAIQSFAKTFGMKTVAEWVETAELQNEVNNLNIDYSQGWLHGKPMAQIDFAKLI